MDESSLRGFGILWIGVAVMAANLTPQYLDAEEKYRAAKTPEEKLAALEEMWRELPKHKSSEKIQAELKKKLSAARKAVQQPGKKGPTRADPFCVPKTGAGQIVLIGTPNVGKSSIVGGLTKAHVKITDYPFATTGPVPGSVPYEDIQIQLIDTPPVTADHVPPGFPGLWRLADVLIVVADLSSDCLLEDVETCLNHLTERNIELTDGPRELPEEAGAMLKVPGFVLANKIDVPGASDNLDMLRELYGERVRIEPLSTGDADRMAWLAELFFKLVRVVRVYAKPPGKKPDLDEPFVLPIGSDIHELARKVYRGLEDRVKSARLWGSGVADGQQVHLDHVLHDKDIVELHA
jgi:ribosome-interacting GTPase 1